MVSNCSFSGNSAGILGGAMYFHAGAPILNNCILWANYAVILGDEIYLGGGSEPEVNYSDVQGGFPGIANIDADPLFVDPGFWDDN